MASFFHYDILDIQQALYSTLSLTKSNCLKSSYPPTCVSDILTTSFYLSAIFALFLFPSPLFKFLSSFYCFFRGIFKMTPNHIWFKNINKFLYLFRIFYWHNLTPFFLLMSYIPLRLHHSDLQNTFSLHNHLSYSHYIHLYQVSQSFSCTLCLVL